MTADPVARHALIFTGGPLPRGLRALPDADLIIAADSGIDNAEHLGLTVDLLVGDLDSASSKAKKSARAVESHPVDKDETDLELALTATLAGGATSATIVGTFAGRLDHALGNMLVVTASRWNDLQINMLIDSARAWVVWDQISFEGHRGDLVSLLAVNGPASGVTTSGLAWPLQDANLAPGVGLGLSNQMSGVSAEVSVDAGTVLVIAPHGTDP